MNILFINDGSLLNPILRSQGIPQLRALSQKGYKIYLLSFETTSNSNDMYYEIVQQYQINIEFIRFNIRYEKYIKGVFQIVTLGTLYTIYYAVKYKINIIHARSYLPTLVGLFVKYFHQCKVIFDMRGLFVEEMIEKNKLKNNSILYFVFRKIENYCLTNSDKVVVVTNKFRDHIHKQNISFKKIETIYNSVNLELFTNELGVANDLATDLGCNNKLVFTYSGSSETWQQTEAIIHFFSIISKINKDTLLLIISYGNTDEYDNIVRKYKINHDNYRICSLNYSEVPKYLRLSNYGLLFRKDQLLNNVAAPLKFGEYLACGIPVLLSKNIGDASDIVDKYNVGIVIDELSEEYINSIYPKIISINKSKISLQCREVAEKYYSISESIEKYDKLYSELGSF